MWGHLEKFSDSIMGENNMDKEKWEKVTDHPLDDTYKLKVPGGYIYRCTTGSNHNVAMVFVPVEDGSWMGDFGLGR
jgi:hypothetical protein